MPHPEIQSHEELKLPSNATEGQDDPQKDDDAAELAALIAAIKETKDADTELDADDPAAWDNSRG